MKPGRHQTISLFPRHQLANSPVGTRAPRAFITVCIRTFFLAPLGILDDKLIIGAVLPVSDRLRIQNNYTEPFLNSMDHDILYTTELSWRRLTDKCL